MLFVGNQRGGGKDLAVHLMKQENDLVEVHEIRGFIGKDLESAFKESYAISKATHCRKHLYSLSINPPPGKSASVEDFEKAIEKAETKLGLTGQPRAIVFHEKEGRRHAHAVWCRINTDEMKAVQLSFDHPKLMEVSRELYIEHDWKMPRGMMNSKDRDPFNFTLAEWQQAKRAGKNAREVKSTIMDCWAVSDSKASFAHALEEHGYILAQGRRGHVAVDYQGEAFPISRAVGLKAKQIRHKLGEIDDLPTAAKAHAKAASLITTRLKTLQSEESQDAQKRQTRLETEREEQRKAQEEERKRLAQQQAQRRKDEEIKRQARLRKGFMGLIDRVSGKRKRTLEQNKQESIEAARSDKQEQDIIKALQGVKRQELKERTQSLRKHYEGVSKELSGDIKRIETKAAHSEDQDREVFKAKRREARERPKRRSSRIKARDGPSLG